jgi:hypothetical protein
MALMVATAVALGACGGADTTNSTTLPASTSTTAAREVVTLKLGVTGGTFDAQAPHLIETINRISSGQLSIEHADEWDITGTDPDAERKIIEAVAAGDLDLGLVGTRVLTEMGVADFNALIAPMLIDSYSLERAVLDSGIPAQMLPALVELGVTGLAVIGGGLRFPSGVEAPFLGPDTYADRVFHVFNSDIGSQLAVLSYGRAAEREADSVGVDMLNRADIRGAGLVGFFRRIGKETGDDGKGITRYLGTHPPTGERAADIEGRAIGRGDAMSAAEWQALRTRCTVKR